jgi:hypothetical protein
MFILRFERGLRNRFFEDINGSGDFYVDKICQIREAARSRLRPGL